MLWYSINVKKYINIIYYMDKITKFLKIKNTYIYIKQDGIVELIPSFLGPSVYHLVIGTLYYYIVHDISTNTCKPCSACMPWGLLVTNKLLATNMKCDIHK